MAQSRLLALAILICSQKPAHVRSLHFHNTENLGFSSTFYTIQQDFLFDPGSYRRTGEATVIPEAEGWSSVKHAMAALLRALQNEGWHAVLEYKADCPFDREAMPDLLIPSKNGDLKTIPSLEQDLILVERACNEKAMAGGIQKACGWNSPRLMTIYPLRKASPVEGEPFGRTQLYDSNSLSLTLCPLGLKQRWGSDLELASPKLLQIAMPKAAPAHQGPLKPSSPSSKQDRRALLDLNLDISDSLSEHTEEDCFPPPPSMMSEESCFSVECFAPDSPMCYDKAFFYSRARMKQFTPSSSSDESNLNSNTSISTSTSALRAHVVSEMNSNSCTRSSGILSAARIGNIVGFTRERSFQESPAASTDHSCWKEESSVTQNWGPLPPSNGEVNVNRARARSNSTSERITEITLHELSQYFHMPITQASKELKVGLTVLKKRCREFGIPRWPHRKMKSLESLINNIQDLAKDQGVKTSERVVNAVKELEEQKKLMEEMPGTELAERTKRLRQACFKANYKKRRLIIGPSSHGNISPPRTKVQIPPLHKQPSIVLDFKRGSSDHIGFL